jgi:hypothetical protein
MRWGGIRSTARLGLIVACLGGVGVYLFVLLFLYIFQPHVCVFVCAFSEAD